MDPRRRVLPPLLMLITCVSIVRFAPALARPAGHRGECDRIKADDGAALERCLALNQDDVGLLIELGRQMERSGERDHAEDAYRRALRFDPQDPDIHLRLGTLLLARGDRAGARAEAREALKRQPHSVAAGELARLAGDPQ